MVAVIVQNLVGKYIYNIASDIIEMLKETSMTPLHGTVLQNVQTVFSEPCLRP